MFANPSNFRKIDSTKHLNSKHQGKVCQGEEKEVLRAKSREQRARSEELRALSKKLFPQGRQLSALRVLLYAIIGFAL